MPVIRHWGHSRDTTTADMREDLRAAKNRPFIAKLKSGDYNEEISCSLGLIFLITALVVGKTIGPGWKTNLLYLGAYLFAG